MSISLESISIINPKTTSYSTSNRASMALLCASPQLSSSLRFNSLLRRSHRYGVSINTRLIAPLTSRNRGIVSFAASHEDSMVETEIEVEKERKALKVETERSQEAWKEALASFKEQALKMQSVSQEAYEVYSKKAMVILKENSDQLKIQADKTKHDLTVIAKEISEEGQEYLSTAAKTSPEPVKDIVETFASSKDDLNDIAKVKDYHLGILYSSILSLSGFLYFMITGSISGIGFGIILGGTLLALSISILRSRKRGESFPLAEKGQAAIASMLFLRQLRMLTQKACIAGGFRTLISGATVAIYVYIITSNRKLTGGSNLDHGTET